VAERVDGDGQAAVVSVERDGKSIDVPVIAD
jgi:hypothetical protein